MYRQQLKKRKKFMATISGDKDNYVIEPKVTIGDIPEIEFKNVKYILVTDETNTIKKLDIKKLRIYNQK